MDIIEKYKALILGLDLKDDELYSKGSIVDKSGVGRPEKLRLYAVLGWICLEQEQLSEKGDGWIEIDGQAPIRGWYGRHWKKALQEDPRWEEE